MRSEKDLAKEYQKRISDAESTKAFAEAKDELETAFNNKDYRKILQLYSNKGLIKEVGQEFGFSGDHYIEHVKRLIKNRTNCDIIEAIKSELYSLDI